MQSKREWLPKIQWFNLVSRDRNTKPTQGSNQFQYSGTEVELKGSDLVYTICKRCQKNNDSLSDAVIQKWEQRSFTQLALCSFMASGEFMLQRVTACIHERRQQLRQSSTETSTPGLHLGACIWGRHLGILYSAGKCFWRDIFIFLTLRVSAISQMNPSVQIHVSFH